MPAPDEEIDYPCDECRIGVLALKRCGVFVMGRCDRCPHYVEFELSGIAADVILAAYAKRIRGAGTESGA